MLNALNKITTTAKKRVGRGVGSGKGGHTAGRGSKGHKSREGGTIPLWFEGGQLPLIKRLPYLRGKFHFRSLAKTVVVIPVEKLRRVTDGIVSHETLVTAGLISSVHERVKIVNGGQAPALKEIRGIALSASVRTMFESAGVKIS